MRPPGAARDCDAVARTRITIVLELDETSDGPVGSAHLPDGTAHEFHGWLALAAIIDSLGRVARGPSPAHTSAHTSDDTSDERETP
jgi:hypothetical protein